MKHRPFGPTGKEVSVIGQGTWNMEKDELDQQGNYLPIDDLPQELAK